MTDKLLEIIKNNDWDILKVEIKNVDSTIQEDFQHEKEFLDFIDDNIEKFEAKYNGYESIFNEENNKITLLFKFSFDKEKKLSKEYIRSLADDIMLNLSEEEIEEIQNTEESLRTKFMKVLTIDTQDVMPKFYPFETAHSFLREDDDSHTISHEGVLNNAPTKSNDYITVVKVVK